MIAWQRTWWARASTCCSSCRSPSLRCCWRRWAWTGVIAVQRGQPDAGNRRAHRARRDPRAPDRLDRRTRVDAVGHRDWCGLRGSAGPRTPAREPALRPAGERSAGAFRRHRRVRPGALGACWLPARRASRVVSDCGAARGIGRARRASDRRACVALVRLASHRCSIGPAKRGARRLERQPRRSRKLDSFARVFASQGV